MNKAVFLDRDGTISVEVGYIDSKDDLELYEDSAEALSDLKKMGFYLIVITNQSGVARGYFPESRVLEINDHLNVLLSKHDVKIDAFYYCPHHPEKAENKKYLKKCSCRKPGTDLALEAAEKFNIDLSRSYFVGDKMSDIGCGFNLGMKTLLVETGHGKEEIVKISQKDKIKPDFICKTLKDVKERIQENIKYDA